MQQLSTKKETLENVLDQFRFFTGLVISKQADNQIKFEFTAINTGNETSFPFIVITSYDSTYVVSELNPRLSDLYQNIHYLTTYKDIRQFIRSMRLSFIKYFEDANKQANPYTL